MIQLIKRKAFQRRWKVNVLFIAYRFVDQLIKAHTFSRHHFQFHVSLPEVHGPDIWTMYTQEHTFYTHLWIIAGVEMCLDSLINLTKRMRMHISVFLSFMHVTPDLMPLPTPAGLSLSKTLSPWPWTLVFRRLFCLPTQWFPTLAHVPSPVSKSTVFSL